MKKFLSNKNKSATNIIAIAVNAILFLAAPTSDLVDWFFKTIEFLVFINMLFTSWKWRNSVDTPIIYSEIFYTLKSFIPKNK